MQTQPITLTLDFAPAGTAAHLVCPHLDTAEGALVAMPALPADADELHLRAEDVAAASPDWREKVREAINQSGAVAYRDPKGKLLGLFGCNSGSGGPGLPETFRWASPWLLCDDLPDDLARAVFRASVAWSDLLHALARSGVFVFNLVPKHSPQNRRFIEALGFTIDPNPDPAGRDVFFLKGAAHV